MSPSSSLLFICSSLLLFFCFTHGQYDPAVFIYNTTLTSSNQQYTNNFAGPSGQLWIATIPCFGQYNWYIGDGYVPTTTNFTYAHFAQTGDSYSAYFHNSSQFAYSINLLVVATVSYGGVNAQFDLIIYTGDPTTLIPVPGNNGNIQGSEATGASSGSFTWHITNNTQVYYFDGTPSTGGNFPYTACSVERYMTPYSSSIGSITNNNDGTWTATVKSLGSKPFTVSVVATRSGGYQVAYNALEFNGLGASLAVPSLFFLGLVILALTSF